MKPQHQPVQPPRPAGVVRFYNFLAPGNRFRDDVFEGLAADPKFIAPRWSLNESGIRIHRVLADLPEWYQTRDESALVRDHLDELAQLIGANAQLIEIGGGASSASLLLIDRLEPVLHMQVDADPVALTGAARGLSGVSPWLNICGILADPAGALALPEFVGLQIRRKIVWLPASALTRFTPDQLYEALRTARRMIGRAGGLLVAVDLKTDHKRLVEAYSDAEGVMALYNANLLARANDELEADFQTSRFGYRAFYDEVRGRVVMAMESRFAQFVRVGDERFDFAAGERLVTGIASLYTTDGFLALARDAGLTSQMSWMDDGHHLCLHWMVAV